jgi:hypothetical protein
VISSTSMLLTKTKLAWVIKWKRTVLYFCIINQAQYAYLV